jgi:hypothetical protein
LLFFRPRTRFRSGLKASSTGNSINQNFATRFKLKRFMYEYIIFRELALSKLWKKLKKCVLSSFDHSHSFDFPHSRHHAKGSYSGKLQGKDETIILEWAVSY